MYVKGDPGSGDATHREEYNNGEGYFIDQTRYLTDMTDVATLDTYIKGSQAIIQSNGSYNDFRTLIRLVYKKLLVYIRFYYFYDDLKNLNTTTQTAAASWKEGTGRGLGATPDELRPPSIRHLVVHLEFHYEKIEDIINKFKRGGMGT